MDTGTRVECQWCKSQNLPGARTCLTCGAPLDVRNLVSDSGWREAPRLRDMTEIRFGQSTCQVEGHLHFEHPAGTWRSWRSWGERYIWLRLTGPGRVSVHSAYDKLEDPGHNLAGSSPATRFQWRG